MVLAGCELADKNFCRVIAAPIDRPQSGAYFRDDCKLKLNNGKRGVS